MFEDIKIVLIDAINVDEEEIKPEAKLNDDLGIDSLAAVELALELENEFDIRIEDEELAKEKRVQQAMLTIKKKFGKNAILKGMNLEEGATAKDRNAQLGGHKE